MSTANPPIVAALRQRVLGVLEPLLGGSRRAALVDFPDYANVGDSAIWLGQRAALRRLGVHLAYACDRRSYRAESLRRRLGDGVILLSGGGNFGDLYPSHQRLRERVLADFPATPVIQLPQTLHFQRAGALEQSRDRLEAHQRLVLLVRDRRSLEVARASFRAPSRLCPDMAFCLSMPPRRRPRARDAGRILWLLRADGEAADPEGRHLRTRGGVPAETTDWPGEPQPKLARWSRSVARRAGRPGPTARLAGHLTAATYTRLARRRVVAGCRLLTSAAAVVTDRLHGHILCLLLGIPHVLLDNANGKVRGFHESWTADSPLVRWAADLEEAETLATGLLDDGAVEEPGRAWS